MGFCEFLTLIFIVLKVFGVISWSWWLVLLPEIIASVLYIGFIVISFSHGRRTKRAIGRLFGKRNF